MRASESEIRNRLIRFLDQDADGLRRFVLQTIVETKEITVVSLYAMVNQRFSVSQRAVASLVGYICSRLGILRAHRDSYRSPTVYVLREEYTDMAMFAIHGV